ncbi:MAG: hypothetical protein COB85_04610 [Bacteroidetes bacterium]|nr:MAG: hypothetical protein COB85_04610 [Bacteroidota bacterium]
MKIHTTRLFVLAFSFLLVTNISNAQTTWDVVANAFSFSPANITIIVGDSVRWTNTSGSHNVNGTTTTYPSNPESFGNAVASAWVFTYGFTIAGTYNYQCDVHVTGGMTGVITVLEPGDASCHMVVAPAAGSTLTLNSSYTVTLRLHNDSNTVITSIPVKFSLNGPGNTPLNEIWTGTLNPGDSVDYTFTSQFTVADTSDSTGYGIADMAGDLFPPNNLATVAYVFSNTNGIENAAGNSQLNLAPIYPNPASNNLSLVISGNKVDGDAIISLISVEGKILKELSYSNLANDLQVNIDVSDLPSGLYFVSVVTESGSAYRKFVK